MVIFHTDHWGALSQFIMLAINKHKHEEKVLIVTEDDSEKVKIANNLKDAGVFTKVVMLSHELAFPGSKINDEEKIKECIIETHERVFEEHQIRLDKNDIFYTLSDILGVFRLYLVLKGYKYIHVMACSDEIYLEYRRNTAYSIGLVSRTYMDLLNQYNVLFATNKLCEKLIVLPDTEIKEGFLFDDTEVELFDFKHSIDGIGAEDAKKILDCFELDINCSDTHKTVLISNSIDYLRGCIIWSGYDGKDPLEHIMLYQLLADFYSGCNIEDLVIKPHPNINVNWERYFPQSSIMGKAIPVEMLRLFKNHNNITFANALILMSTSLAKVDDVFGKISVATQNYAKNYHSISSLFVSCCFADWSIPLYFNGYGFDTDFIDSFCENVMEGRISGECINNNTYPEGESFVIMKKLDHKSFISFNNRVKRLDGNSAVAFLSMSEELPLYNIDRSAYSNMVILRIEKEAMRSLDTIVVPLEAEYICVVTKSAEMRQKLREFTLSRELSVTGVRFNVKALSDCEKDMFWRNYALENDHRYCLTENSATRKLLAADRHGNGCALRRITNLAEYLSALRDLEDLTAYMGIMDNAGDYYTYSIVRGLKEIGFTIDFCWLGWNSLNAVVDNGRVVYEHRGVRAETSEYRTEEFGVLAEIDSRTFNHGNLCSIKINGIDHSCNKRGLNIVVYDKKQRCVVDSVCFDLFNNRQECHRK